MKKLIIFSVVVLVFFSSAMPMLENEKNLSIKINKKNQLYLLDLPNLNNLSPQEKLSRLMNITENVLGPVITKTAEKSASNSPREYTEKQKVKYLIKETFLQSNRMSNEFLTLMKSLPPEICEKVKTRWRELVEKYVDPEKIETVEEAIKNIKRYCLKLHKALKKQFDLLSEAPSK